MRKGFIVVSGCPRSGTSLQMEIHREVHGDDAICGYQFPQEHRSEIIDENLKKKENESFFTWQTRKYIIEKI